MNEIFILGIFSFIMGFVNSIAGGGGVFGVPAMLAIGLPPVNALTLNRISDIGNIVGSLRNYKKVDGFDARLAYLAVPPILIGAFVGANFITGLSEETLNQIVLGAVCVGILLLIYPFQKSGEAKTQHKWLGVAALILLGFWDGAFAMAGGTFGVLIFVLLFGKTYVNAKGVMTYAAIPETIMSAGILYMSSTVSIPQIASMFLCAVVGSYMGSHLAIRKGSNFIRYTMAVLAVFMLAKVIIFDL